MHLFQLEVQPLGDDSQFCHVFLPASRVGRYEIRNELLAQVFLAVDTVKDTLELMKLLEGRLAHQMEHPVRSMFGSHFQSSADMAADKFAGILLCCFVGFLIIRTI